jgi:hypothetical protein
MPRLATDVSEATTAFHQELVRLRRQKATAVYGDDERLSLPQPRRNCRTDGTRSTEMPTTIAGRTGYIYEQD